MKAIFKSLMTLCILTMLFTSITSCSSGGGTEDSADAPHAYLLYKQGGYKLDDSATHQFGEWDIITSHFHNYHDWGPITFRIHDSGTIQIGASSSIYTYTSTPSLASSIASTYTGTISVPDLDLSFNMVDGRPTSNKTVTFNDTTYYVLWDNHAKAIEKGIVSSSNCN